MSDEPQTQDENTNVTPVEDAPEPTTAPDVPTTEASDDVEENTADESQDAPVEDEGADEPEEETSDEPVADEPEEAKADVEPCEACRGTGLSKGEPDAGQLCKECEGSGTVNVSEATEE